MIQAMRGRLPLSDRGPTLRFVRQAIEENSVFAADRYILRQQQEGVALVTLARFGATGSPSSIGTASILNDSTGSYVNYATAAALGSTAGWSNQSICIVPTSFPIRWTLVFKTGAAASDIASIRIMLGFGNVLSSATDSQTIDAAYFRYSTSAGDTNWMAATSDGTQAETDTGVAVVEDTRYIFQIKIVDTSTYEFYIDGDLVATRTTNVPTSTQTMQLIALSRNLVAAVKNVRIRLWTVESK